MSMHVQKVNRVPRFLSHMGNMWLARETINNEGDIWGGVGGGDPPLGPLWAHSTTCTRNFLPWPPHPEKPPLIALL